MNCLDAATRKRLKARLEKKEEQLEEANNIYSELLSDRIHSYRFNSNEGDQSTVNKKLKDVKEQIDSLESEIDRLVRRLTGRSVVNMNMRRIR